MKLDDILGLFIHRVDVKVTNLLRTKMEPFQIAPEQNLILLLLLERDGLTQNEIAEHLDKDKTNIARMVSSLEKKGFIIRISSQQDRRYVRVHISEKGKDLCDQIRPLLEEVNEQVSKNISKEELIMLDPILHKIYKNVQ